MKKNIIIILCFFASQIVFSQGKMKMALLKYRGGGDWYAVVDAMQNIVKFSNKELGTNLDADYATIEVGSAEIFNYPFLFMTGHGNIVLNDEEATNLRNYCYGGGFVFIDDDYGMDPYAKVALKKIFPENALQELPFEHPVFHQKFNFTKGIPKVHEHEGKAPKTYGVFHENRLCLIYAAESNISDGWESPEVHKDPEEVRQQSLRMGANILQFAFQQ
jgi:Domain of unknown function (DUF4159)